MADEEEHDPLDDVPSIPRVQEMGWTIVPKPQAVKREQEVKFAAIGWTLRPWTASPKEGMVTMSDLGMDARPLGGKKPARRPVKPKLLQDPDDASDNTDSSS